jgi:DNA topoisomerase III
MELIIAEKPSVAADIAKALGDFKKCGEWYEGANALITSAVGHMCGIRIPKEQDPGSRLERLPAIPDPFELYALESSEDRLKTILSLIKRRDVTMLVNACDAGREGELIFRYIVEYSGSTKPIERMWLQSMTPDAIRASYASKRTGAEMQSLSDAAHCRSEADFLIGINGTRVMSKLGEIKVGQHVLVTVGRVQTPVLAMVVDLENKIRNFKPQAFRSIVGTFASAAGEYEGTWFDPAFKASGADGEKDDRVFDEARATAIVAECAGATVDSVEDTAARSKPQTRLHGGTYADNRTGTV